MYNFELQREARVPTFALNLFMKAYFISGMAADSRVFKHIRLPQGYEPVFLEWIDPLPDESLQSYALRLANGINNSEPFALIGLSFGGMVATEIARQYKPVITILISSIPVSAHLPFYFRVAAKLKLHKIVPISLLKTAAEAKRFFTREKSEDKEMIVQQIRESNPDMIRWSMGAILNWKNDFIPEPVCHIHGTHDEILPIRFTRPTHIIRRAGHMLIMSEASEVNDILSNTLTSVPPAV